MVTPTPRAAAVSDNVDLSRMMEQTVTYATNLKAGDEPVKHIGTVAKVA
jgi:hypothetical protein